MKIIDLNPSFYCLFVDRGGGHTKRFLQAELSPNPKRYRIDLFENEDVLKRWVQEEQAVFAQNEQWNMHEMYSRFYAEKISVQDFATLMEKQEEIDSVTFINNDGVRRVYFRIDFADDFSSFPVAHQKLYAKEPIYMINRQRELNEKVVLQKESYFVTYPQVANPLFSVGSRDWAEELVDRKPNQGYYIEQTTLHDVYMRLKLEDKDPGFFILSREEAPHYLLRKADLKKIMEGTLDYR